MNNSTRDKLQNAIDMFKRTNRLHMRVFDKYVDNLEVRRRPHHILRYLYIKYKENQTGVCQKSIAENFDISTAAVAVTLKKLEAIGFVEKSVNENDSRFNSVVITQKGINLIERTKEAFWRIDSAMFEDLSEQEIETFISCLDKMHNRLKAMYESDKGDVLEKLD